MKWVRFDSATLILVIVIMVRIVALGLSVTIPIPTREHQQRSDAEDDQSEFPASNEGDNQRCRNVDECLQDLADSIRG